MVLDNKLGIVDAVELAREEERISKLAALSLYRGGPLDRLAPGTFDTLGHIHCVLFGDIYDFAGTVRSVNLAKGSFRFASALYLSSALKRIEAMPQGTFDEIVEKYVEMNIAHPFREGVRDASGLTICSVVNLTAPSTGARLGARTTFLPWSAVPCATWSSRCC